MNGYSVYESHGCRVIYRPIPITDLVALMEAWAKGQTPDNEWVCDAILAEHINAVIVCGPLSATQAWRNEIGLA